MPKLVLPRLIAHRGASKIAPENTLIAFEKAKALGASWIELDVMLTKDNVLIVHHDDTFKRILDFDQNVQHTLFSQIKDRDAGSWFGAQFSHARIPTLAQTLSLCEELNLNINIEIKADVSFAVPTALATLQVLSQFPYFTHEHILISSQTLLALQTVADKTSEYALGLVANNWADVNAALLTDISFYSLNLHYPLLNSENIKPYLSQGLEILCFTVNDRKIANQLFSWGVCSVFSDDALLLQ